MPILDPAHLVRRRRCVKDRPTAHDRALEAAQLIVLAYSLNFRSGGRIDWEALDRAYVAASEAVYLDRAERP